MFPFQLAFVGLLAAYCVYSFWARLDPRYPMYGAFLLLLGAIGAQWVGSAGAADNLALDVIFALGAAVALAGAERLRPRRTSSERAPPETPGAEPAQAVEPTA